MDPNATLRRIDALLRDGGDDDEVRELRASLREWIGRGGFAPDWRACPVATSYYLFLVAEEERAAGAH